MERPGHSPLPREAAIDVPNPLGMEGIEFVEASALHPTARGALTRAELGELMFELVHHDAALPQARAGAAG
jgi:hypothetical protein